MKTKSLSSIDAQTILMFADCNMCVSKTADNLFYHRNTIIARLQRIHAKTGLNPLSFYDLVELVAAAKEVEQDDE
ncbi:MAG: helix-turn-helix domain-containing protein [Oscillibacter ruminantium]|uniref:helix-turn-helix domain-containing protein n=1 Tax=Oscillibacter ruminantium TaxID=1263547 RepID=UPI002B1ECF4E|nr:helix-turn-helix domain-containing protein [Oscillibacter ruminantium]MEA5042218.1 helix-turn-helix domain-containing protein [Oscillibacter ruminantium]